VTTVARASGTRTTSPVRPSPRTAPARLIAWTFGSHRPLWQLIRQRGPLLAAPVAMTFLWVCLAVSGLWVMRGTGHRLIAACCAYRSWHPGLGPSVRLLMSAFLLRHGYEVLWTIAATGLVLAPFEALVGSGRMLAIIALGHVVPTVAVAGLAADRQLGGGGLDVGASAVVVAAAAGLAVAGRSVPVAIWLAVAQMVGVVVQTPLASGEHLIALGTGAVLTWGLSTRPPGTRAPQPRRVASPVAGRYRRMGGGRRSRSA
jgi:hypothetical protein